jgi:hypothetical protein
MGFTRYCILFFAEIQRKSGLLYAILAPLLPA